MDVVLDEEQEFPEHASTTSIMVVIRKTVQGASCHLHALSDSNFLRVRDSTDDFSWLIVVLVLKVRILLLPVFIEQPPPNCSSTTITLQYYYYYCYYYYTVLEVLYIKRLGSLKKKYQNDSNDFLETDQIIIYRKIDPPNNDHTKK
jgi:hypothetical protein